MRVIIYGAGAIGGVVGGHLARIGLNVILISRPEHVKAIQGNGLRFITPTGTYILRLPAVTTPNQINLRPDDVVFLCMKGQNTEEALHDLRAVTKDLPIFCFQNGVRNEEITARYFPRVYGVRVYVGANYLTNGEVVARYDPPGSLIMGCYPMGIDVLVETIATKLRTAGFLVMVTSNVMPYKWGKLMFNLINAVDSITNAKRGDNAVITKAAQQEAAEILNLAGIRWISAEELALEWPESTMQTRISLPVEVRSSSWQSLVRQQGTIETDFLNGEIVRLAKKMGRQAPINEGLLHISQEMATNRELPGKYTPAQLCTLLGLDYPSQNSKF